jgi:anti-sigma B factor antagonist
MSFILEKIDHITLITLKSDKLNFENAPDLKTQIVLSAKEDEFSPLIIDLTNVQFADSSGLSALLLAQRTYRDSDRPYVICSVNERVMRLLEVSHLHTVFQLAANREEAFSLV